MTETETAHPHITEISQGEEMLLRNGRPALIGRDPQQADYITPGIRNKCDVVSLKIDNPDILNYISRAALLMLSQDGTTSIGIPHEASVEITAYDTRNNPKTIFPGEKTVYTDGNLDRLDLAVNNHIVRLRLTGTTNGDQMFRLEVDPQ